ncbi:SpoIIE family protein phosphatase [Neptuniibacter sp. CAU 1671]|uniref:ATP-binding SpoIIE family protein phosphatase n=1 Tax=Neptuniibacter sp. CAU 1671 TaxID=3032593 RepID=UPI0023DA633B|nr:SpoIIE family protein phosphatase [Neptuniibacter sp. CAU 1671]MDF2182583.1 SpoIIE family protein phosphatase [Neptuniibacter sp. CAU 1671]
MPQSVRASGKEVLILIADDVAPNRELLAHMVKNMGFESIMASNGHEAIEQFERFRPDLVLMDISMPVMNGIDATREIKQQADERFVPIVFVSAAVGPEAIRSAIEAGGDDFLQMPFPYELLEGKIIALLRISELYSEVAKLNALRSHEAELAEKLLSNAVESGNVPNSQVRMHKQPAETFSGDVLLSAYRPNGDLNVLLGDFTGHGLTAAVGALPLSETFRAMTAKGYEAEEIVAQINRKLGQLLPTGKFLATAMLTLTAEGTVKIWNGGLPDVLIVSKGKVVHRIASSHPPLGILKKLNDTHFQLFKVEPEDRILMLSDGVLEAVNAQDEQYSEARLIDVIEQCPKGFDLISAILSSLQNFMHGQVQRDDISLITVPGWLENNTLEQVKPAYAFEVDSEEEGILDTWTWHIELQGQSLHRTSPVAQALSRLQESEGPRPEWQQVFTVITELYVNALDHGVLGLSSNMKRTPEGFARYFDEREKRLQSLDSGKVSLSLQHTRMPGGGRLVIRVEDSGKGFDYDWWLKNLNQSAERQFSGRGISLVKNICEYLTFSHNGSVVEAVMYFGDKH